MPPKYKRSGRKSSALKSEDSTTTSLGGAKDNAGYEWVEDDEESTKNAEATAQTAEKKVSLFSRLFGSNKKSELVDSRSVKREPLLPLDGDVDDRSESTKSVVLESEEVNLAPTPREEVFLSGKRAGYLSSSQGVDAEVMEVVRTRRGVENIFPAQVNKDHLGDGGEDLLGGLSTKPKEGSEVVYAVVKKTPKELAPNSGDIKKVEVREEKVLYTPILPPPLPPIDYKDVVYSDAEVVKGSQPGDEGPALPPRVMKAVSLDLVEENEVEQESNSTRKEATFSSPPPPPPPPPPHPSDVGNTTTRGKKLEKTVSFQPSSNEHQSRRLSTSGEVDEEEAREDETIKIPEYNSSKEANAGLRESQKNHIKALYKIGDKENGKKIYLAVRDSLNKILNSEEDKLDVQEALVLITKKGLEIKSEGKTPFERAINSIVYCLVSGSSVSKEFDPYPKVLQKASDSVGLVDAKTMTQQRRASSAHGSAKVEEGEEKAAPNKLSQLSKFQSNVVIEMVFWSKEDTFIEPGKKSLAIAGNKRTSSLEARLESSLLFYEWIADKIYPSLTEEESKELETIRVGERGVKEGSGKLEKLKSKVNELLKEINERDRKKFEGEPAEYVELNQSYFAKIAQGWKGEKETADLLMESLTRQIKQINKAMSFEPNKDSINSGIRGFKLKYSGQSVDDNLEAKKLRASTKEKLDHAMELIGHEDRPGILHHIVFLEDGRKIKMSVLGKDESRNGMIEIDPADIAVVTKAKRRIDDKKACLGDVMITFFGKDGIEKRKKLSDIYPFTKDYEPNVNGLKDAAGDCMALCLLTDDESGYKRYNTFFNQVRAADNKRRGVVSDAKADLPKGRGKEAFKAVVEALQEKLRKRDPKWWERELAELLVANDESVLSEIKKFSTAADVELIKKSKATVGTQVDLDNELTDLLDEKPELNAEALVKRIADCEKQMALLIVLPDSHEMRSHPYLGRDEALYLKYKEHLPILVAKLKALEKGVGKDGDAKTDPNWWEGELDLLRQQDQFGILRAVADVFGSEPNNDDVRISKNSEAMAVGERLERIHAQILADSALNTSESLDRALKNSKILMAHLLLLPRSDAKCKNGEDEAWYRQYKNYLPELHSRIRKEGEKSNGDGKGLEKETQTEPEWWSVELAKLQKTDGDKFGVLVRVRKFNKGDDGENSIGRHKMFPPQDVAYDGIGALTTKWEEIAQVENLADRDSAENIEVRKKLLASLILLPDVDPGSQRGEDEALYKRIDADLVRISEKQQAADQDKGKWWSVELDNLGKEDQLGILVKVGNALIDKVDKVNFESVRRAKEQGTIPRNFDALAQEIRELNEVKKYQEALDKTKELLAQLILLPKSDQRYLRTEEGGDKPLYDIYKNHALALHNYLEAEKARVETKGVGQQTKDALPRVIGDLKRQKDAKDQSAGTEAQRKKSEQGAENRAALLPMAEEDVIKNDLSRDEEKRKAQGELHYDVMTKGGEMLSAPDAQLVSLQAIDKVRQGEEDRKKRDAAKTKAEPAKRGWWKDELKKLEIEVDEESRAKKVNPTAPQNKKHFRIGLGISAEKLINAFWPQGEDLVKLRNSKGDILPIGLSIPSAMREEKTSDEEKAELAELRKTLAALDKGAQRREYVALSIRTSETNIAKIDAIEQQRKLAQATFEKSIPTREEEYAKKLVAYNTNQTLDNARPLLAEALDLATIRLFLADNARVGDDKSYEALKTKSLELLLAHSELNAEIEKQRLSQPKSEEDEAQADSKLIAAIALEEQEEAARRKEEEDQPALNALIANPLAERERLPDKAKLTALLAASKDLSAAVAAKEPEGEDFAGIDALIAGAEIAIAEEARLQWWQKEVLALEREVAGDKSPKKLHEALRKALGNDAIGFLNAFEQDLSNSSQPLFDPKRLSPQINESIIQIVRSEDDDGLSEKRRLASIFLQEQEQKYKEKYAPAKAELKIEKEKLNALKEEHVDPIYDISDRGQLEAVKKIFDATTKLMALHLFVSKDENSGDLSYTALKKEALELLKLYPTLPEFIRDTMEAEGENREEEEEEHIYDYPDPWQEGATKELNKNQQDKDLVLEALGFFIDKKKNEEIASAVQSLVGNHTPQPTFGEVLEVRKGAVSTSRTKEHAKKRLEKKMLLQGDSGELGMVETLLQNADKQDASIENRIKNVTMAMAGCLLADPKNDTYEKAKDKLSALRAIEKQEEAAKKAKEEPSKVDEWFVAALEALGDVNKNQRHRDAIEEKLAILFHDESDVLGYAKKLVIEGELQPNLAGLLGIRNAKNPDGDTGAKDRFTKLVLRSGITLLKELVEERVTDKQERIEYLYLVMACDLVANPDGSGYNECMTEVERLQKEIEDKKAASDQLRTAKKELKLVQSNLVDALGKTTAVVARWYDAAEADLGDKYKDQRAGIEQALKKLMSSESLQPSTKILGGEGVSTDLAGALAIRHAPVADADEEKKVAKERLKSFSTKWAKEDYIVKAEEQQRAAVRDKKSLKAEIDNLEMAMACCLLGDETADLYNTSMTQLQVAQSKLDKIEDEVTAAKDKEQSDIGDERLAAAETSKRFLTEDDATLFNAAKEQRAQFLAEAAKPKHPKVNIAPSPFRSAGAYAGGLNPAGADPKYRMGSALHDKHPVTVEPGSAQPRVYVPSTVAVGSDPTVGAKDVMRIMYRISKEGKVDSESMNICESWIKDRGGSTTEKLSEANLRKYVGVVAENIARTSDIFYRMKDNEKKMEGIDSQECASALKHAINPRSQFIATQAGVLNGGKYTGKKL